MTEPLFGADRLLWWGLAVALFGYLTHRSVDPKLHLMLRAGERTTRYVSQQEYWEHQLGVKQIEETLGRMFGRRILFTLLAILAPATAFTVYMRPEHAVGPWASDWSSFLWPMAILAVVLLIEIVLIGIAIAMVEHDIRKKTFSVRDLEDAKAEVRYLGRWSWLVPFGAGAATGALIVAATALF